MFFDCLCIFSSTVVALKGSDGVVMAVEKVVGSTLYEPGTNKRIFPIDRHVCASVAGILSDSRAIVERAREEARDYRSTYGRPIPLKYLKDRTSMYMHAYTLYSAVRPFGCAVAIGSWDEATGSELYCLEPSGVANGYKGFALGKAKQSAKAEVEKLINVPKTARELIKEAARIIYMVHDSEKDKHFELELCWVGKETKGLYQIVPPNLFNEAVKYAQDALKSSSDSDNSMS